MPTDATVEEHDTLGACYCEKKREQVIMVYHKHKHIVSPSLALSDPSV